MDVPKIYRGYEVYEDEDGITICGVRDFDPRHTFECGQCFRWLREQDGSYTGVVRGRVANVAYIPGDMDMPGTVNAPGGANARKTADAPEDGSISVESGPPRNSNAPWKAGAIGKISFSGRLVLKNVSMRDLEQVWFDYFDLGRDYGEIKRAIATDEIMRKAVEFGRGIRLLRQEPWETLISFIISSNNRIPRIMKIIEDLSGQLGQVLHYGGREYYSFPDVRALSACDPDMLKACRAGYRCEYIKKTADDIAEGRFDLEKLKYLGAAGAREYLLRLSGVGEKVADCMLLYSGIRYDVFPTDVWVKRVMEELYLGRRAGLGEIRRFASEKFGRYAGFAQQYLFYYARENKIGL